MFYDGFEENIRRKRSELWNEQTICHISTFRKFDVRDITLISKCKVQILFKDCPFN